nr:MAG TPA: hypothetical protein [Caudoviricetes sp.]
MPSRNDKLTSVITSLSLCRCHDKPNTPYNVA